MERKKKREKFLKANPLAAVVKDTWFIGGMCVQVLVSGLYFSPLLNTVLFSSIPPIAKRQPSDQENSKHECLKRVQSVLSLLLWYEL